ncbi:hypothetical protein CCAX7_62950 [Capsulimonas corticalis]|uniref:Uncharacterized protein n=1 Tax=Capsulimonas corticalis TaxID=2219043 RepID=A0A402CWT8_9BACT|nr:hypothetical protein [Capsulimonas corticalis]BDI34244.1 hypothetical protein CCAX7_62950 [Capsulimonas corticalis]
MAKLEIEISPELSTYLEEQAASSGLTVEAWVVQAITPTPKKTLAEALAPYIVPVESRAPLPKRSENDHGVQFAEALAAKKAEFNNPDFPNKTKWD